MWREGEATQGRMEKLPMWAYPDHDDRNADCVKRQFHITRDCFGRRGFILLQAETEGRMEG